MREDILSSLIFFLGKNNYEDSRINLNFVIKYILIRILLGGNMFKNIFKGMGIGVANIIPGVSGGTLAVVFGIYDYLMESVACFFKADKEKKIEYIKFLIQIGIGAVIGILAFSRIIGYLLNYYPKQTKIAFVIMILPSIPLIIKGENYKRWRNIISFVFGFIFIGAFAYMAIKLSGGSEAGVTKILTLSSYLKLVLCGIISIGAMIVPGISGSFLLLLMGEYQNILSYINTFSIVPLMYFGSGVLIGGIIFTKIINYFLNRYRSLTLFFILGIVIASLLQLLLTVFI